MNDMFYMKKALQLAVKGKLTTDPNPNVGCIIVKDGLIVGKGWHKKQGDSHAEIIALKMAGDLAHGSTVYLTLEPCNHYGNTPPCCPQLLISKIKKIVIATIDPNPEVSGKGITFLKKNGILVSYGILEKEAQNINQRFFKRMITGLPWLQLKLGISIDGRIALHNGDSKWITSHESRKDVHNFRSQNQAILSTSISIIRDNPSLNIRYINTNPKNNIKKYQQPIRIIIDSKNRIKPNHPTIKINTGDIWLIRLYKDNQKWPNHVKQIVSLESNKQINLLQLFLLLRKKNINSIWIEAGGTLSGALIEQNLIDELILYISPKILGQTAKPMFILQKMFKINQIKQFYFAQVNKLHTDIRIILKKNKTYNISFTQYK
ncbi:Riboflavin biosynthesis protein RibD [Buchnera aphidicola (Eriosoma lanigerum)]|uniref:bifunctional diaminohydroxyphosphoribosylaminopyrimidine deaminase/5-amino-6-(5-phosphoribosylamino)uracil reductase RibD n=1 Tax=Buchnera aphidicola TaxID=9 RepID=UPI0034645690